MRVTFIILVCLLCLVLSANLPKEHKREKRQTAANREKRQTGPSYFLPADVDLSLDAPVKSTFVCSEPGYYADVDNNCQIFHICDYVVSHDGPEMRQYSFACGNNTIFNQFTLTCDFTEDAVGCEYATTFFDINRRIGTNKETWIHTDADVGDALKYTPHKLKFYHN